jgi:MFS family permease
MNKKLVVLMVTAFVDMVGLLMILPLLPFYADRLVGPDGLHIAGMEIKSGVAVAILVSAFTVAQLLSSPMWGRFSDKWGRRPALLVALGASAVAYVIFGYAHSLAVLFLSRLVQGAGGGTVGVIQAYVADVAAPEDRAKSLGWLSAATNAGVALGPVLGVAAVKLGDIPIGFGDWQFRVGPAAPGLAAALLCVVNMAFAWKYLVESRERPKTGEHAVVRKPGTSREAVMRVLTHSSEPASRLIWIYAIAIGAFQGTTSILALYLNRSFAVTENQIGYLFTYIGILSVVTRALLLGKMVDHFGEPRLSRIGVTLLGIGLATIPFAPNIPMLAISVGLLPLGTAFTFPCVTALLSRVIPNHERGLYMGVQQTFGGASRAIFPVVFGVLFDKAGIGVPFWTSAAFVLFTLALGGGLEGYVYQAQAGATSPAPAPVPPPAPAPPAPAPPQPNKAAS